MKPNNNAPPEKVGIQSNPPTIAAFETLKENGQMPTIPEPTAEAAIRLKLLELAKAEPSGLQLQLDLKKLSKGFGVGIKVLRDVYAEIYAFENTKKTAASARELTEQELAEKIRLEDEERKRQQAEAELKEKALARAEEIALAPNLVLVLQETLKRYFGYIADYNLAGTILLSHGSRLLPRSMGFVFSGPSASGKSDAIISAANLLPPEVVINSTSFSPMALFYLGSLKHKYVIGGELKALMPGEDDDYQQAFRQLISENKITRTVVEKGDKGNLEPHVHTTEGPATFICTTTREQNEFNDEFVNRLSWCATSDDPELTKLVLKSQAKAASAPPDSLDKGIKEIEVEAWRSFHRELNDFPVVIQFSEKIIPAAPDVTARRLYPLLLNYTRVSTILHQATRRTIVNNEIPCLEATVDDYRLAYELITANAPRTLDLVSNKGRKVYSELRQAFDFNEFTRAAAQPILRLSLSVVKRYLGELKNAGCLNLIGKDGKSYVYQIVDTPPDCQHLGLVNPDRLIGSN